MNINENPLDVFTLIISGAGDGKVTERIASHFTNVYATETSTTMVWRLKEKGYQ